MSDPTAVTSENTPLLNSGPNANEVDGYTPEERRRLQAAANEAATRNVQTGGIPEDLYQLLPDGFYVSAEHIKTSSIHTARTKCNAIFMIFVLILVTCFILADVASRTNPKFSSTWGPLMFPYFKPWWYATDCALVGSLIIVGIVLSFHAVNMSTPLQGANEPQPTPQCNALIAKLNTYATVFMSLGIFFLLEVVASIIIQSVYWSQYKNSDTMQKATFDGWKQYQDKFNTFYWSRYDQNGNKIYLANNEIEYFLGQNFSYGLVTTILTGIFFGILIWSNCVSIKSYAAELDFYYAEERRSPERIQERRRIIREMIERQIRGLPPDQMIIGGQVYVPAQVQIIGRPRVGPAVPANGAAIPASPDQIRNGNGNNLTGSSTISPSTVVPDPFINAGPGHTLGGDTTVNSTVITTEVTDNSEAALLTQAPETINVEGPTGPSRSSSQWNQTGDPKRLGSS